jgi:ABC-type Fe3+ transport system permease subunit
MGNPRAAWSLIFGGLATLTLPAAIFTTRYSDSYDLLHAGLAIPISAAFGIAAVILARRARTLARATLGGGGGSKAARAGRLLGILGICLAASATIAVSVYGLLVAVG